MPRRASASTTALPAAAAATTVSLTAATAPTNSTTNSVAGPAISSTSASAAASASGGSGSGSISKTLPAAAASQAGPSTPAPSASQAGPSTPAPSASSPATVTASRPRRIMPSRSRRGGPGVGISDVDTHILETLRRRRENEPLVPAETRLLLTTNSARVRAFGDAAIAGDLEGSQVNLNTSAYERYFDKPEVICAYREQQLIQTPEFTLLSEHEAVGGRFRPRSLDDEGIDTSDAAYEKRHRKYEAFEKRQRLREKEKLKHEHYKLKERIEQLRALEPSAFLGAPDSFFTNSRQHHRRSDADAQGGSTDAPTASSQQNEGEWRKRLMLDVANSLDARYRTLLDTAPSRAPDLPTPTPPPQPPPAPPAQTSASQQAHTPSHNTPAAAVRRSPVPSSSPVPRHPQRVLSLPPPPTEIIELDSDGEEKIIPDVVKVEPVSMPPHAQLSVLTRNDTTETLKLRIKFPNRRPPPTSASPRADQRPPSPRAAASSPKPLASPSPSPTRPRPKPIFKDPGAPPGPYARSPFARRATPQDTAAVDMPSPLPSPLSPQQPSAASLPSTSTTLLTLRRRPRRTSVALKLGSPATTAGIPTSRPQQPPPHAHAHGSGRPHKRPRLELSDEEGVSPGFDTEDDEVDGSAEDARRAEEEEGEGEEPEAEEEEEEDDEGGDGRRQRGRERERPRERWRNSALYREAQRHTGAPTARKTHRNLGIFGLKGFPAEVEHLRDFVPPVWALPRADPRVEAALAGEWGPVREREGGGRRRGDGAARGAERVRGGAAGGDEGGVDGVGAGAGVVVGEVVVGGDGGDSAGVWQRRLRDTASAVAVAVVAEDGEETTSCGKSDAMVLVETASAIDSQATEELVIQ